GVGVGHDRSRRGHVARPRSRPAAPPPAASPAAPPAARRAGRLFGDWHIPQDARHEAVRHAPERHAEARRDVTDGVERLVVGDDVDLVARPRPGEPDAGGDGDAEVAPVADPDRGGAVYALRAALRQDARRLVADDPPVADGDQVETDGDAVERQVAQHALDVLGTARILDVEEDG